MALGALIGAGIGALAGSQASGGGTSTSRSGMNLAPETKLEKMAKKEQEARIGQLGGMVDAGPGMQDVIAGLQGQRGLAQMLQQYGQDGFMPGASDYAQAGQFADATLGASFRQQQEQSARLSARLGRPVNDQILQAKLGQSLAEQRSGVMSQMAWQLPQQRLGYMTQAADVQSQLASQAMANRQAMMSLGSQTQQQERSFRITTAEKWGKQTAPQQGGGLAGALIGGLAGSSMGGGINTLGSEIGGLFKSNNMPAATQQELMDGWGGPARGMPSRGPATSFGSQTMPAAGGFSTTQGPTASGSFYNQQSFQLGGVNPVMSPNRLPQQQQIYTPATQPATTFGMSFLGGR